MKRPISIWQAGPCLGTRADQLPLRGWTRQLLSHQQQTLRIDPRSRCWSARFDRHSAI